MFVVRRTFPPPRKIWVDRMKVIGIYLIVAGHFFPVGNEYIYVFSVPLFFLVSGFLSKAKSFSETLRSIWRNLYLPMLIIVAIYFLEGIVLGSIMTGHDILSYWCRFILGDQTVLKGCWFIYTLILLKLLLLISRDKASSMILSSAFVILSVWLSHNRLFLHWAIANVAIAYLFFQTGFLFKEKIERIVRKIELCDNSVAALVLLLLIAGVVVIGSYNGAPMLYNNDYGKSVVLCYAGGLIGSLSALVVAVRLRTASRFIFSTASGTIVILGFHYYCIRVISICFHEGLQYTAYIWSVAIVAAFYPVIRLCSRYFPWILGRRLCK